MDTHRHDLMTLGVAIGVVVGGGVTLAALLAVLLAPLAPWLVGTSGSPGGAFGSGSCSVQTTAASPAQFGDVFSGLSPAPVSAASLSLRG